MRNYLLFFLLTFPAVPPIWAQSANELSATDTLPTSEHRPWSAFSGFIVPGIALTYGSFSLAVNDLKQLDQALQSRLHYSQHPLRIDDYMQYVPAATAIGLGIAGVPGKHQLRDRAIIMGMSTIMTIGSVRGLKRLVGRHRPDAQVPNSFPSGHTATAFVGATMLWMEYHEQYPWLGIAAYGVAVGTGALRMYNNRHWFSDVVMGAGLGIFNTRLAYWLFPSINRWLFPRTHTNSIAIAPLAGPQQYGLYLKLSL